MRAIETTESGPGEAQVEVNGVRFASHDKIRLKLGRRRCDVIDEVFNGRVATVERIYRDYDGRVYLGVTLDDDPAQDLQRELARYLYFFPDEVEPVSTSGAPENPGRWGEADDEWSNAA